MNRHCAWQVKHLKIHSSSAFVFFSCFCFIYIVLFFFFPFPGSYLLSLSVYLPFSISVYPSICPSLFISFFLSLHSSTSITTFSLFLSIYRSLSLSICLYLPLYLSLFPFSPFLKLDHILFCNPTSFKGNFVSRSNLQTTKRQADNS